jgi:hypothetical protein
MGPFFVPDTYAAKMTAAFGFTHRVEPGTKHIYHTSDTFIVVSLDMRITPSPAPPWHLFLLLPCVRAIFLALFVSFSLAHAHAHPLFFPTLANVLSVLYNEHARTTAAMDWV